MKDLHPALRRIPIILVVVGLLIAVYFEWHEYFTFGSLKEHHRFLLQWSQTHYFLAPMIFLAIYIAAVAISAPIAVFLNVISGYLFGLFWGTIFAVLGAGLGAILIFLAVNSALGDWLEKKAQGWVKSLEVGFHRNAFNYLLALRLIPIIPFWVTNIVAGLLNVNLKTFVIATFLGIIPETFLYIWMGHGLEKMFEAGQTPSLSMLLAPSTLIPLIVLGALPLTPLVYKHFTKRKK